jgi:putative transposase
VVAFIEACRDQFGVGPICRALRQAGVAISPSGYYVARARPPPARAVRDAALEKQILRVYKDSGERYGAWKVWDQLNREGIAAARCTVERLMRKLGLRGVRRGGWKKPRTTVPDPSQDRPADLVNRDFAPPAPDRLWVVDFTFVSTWAGTAYTAFVIDAFARLIAGWRTAVSHSTDLVLDALVMAVTCRARQGVKVAGLIHHSDAGSEYLSIRYGAELAASGIAPSVGTVGDSYDNALAESIIGLYKTEVIDHLGPWETPAQVEAATSEWASWYNTARVMRRTGGRPPAEYEQAWRDGTLGQVPARGPGSRPRRPAGGGGDGRRSLPGRAPPAPAGAPPRTPALLRDGPAGHDGCGSGRASPRRPRDGCHGTPAQVKGASGVAGDDAARHPCPARGTRGAKPGCPTRRYPSPQEARDGAMPQHQAGQTDSAAGQMFDKQKRENDQTCGSLRRGYRGRQRPPRREHLGRIESPPNSGSSGSWPGPPRTPPPPGPARRPAAGPAAPPPAAARPHPRHPTRRWPARAP